MATELDVSPNEVWFSQRTTGGNDRAQKLRDSIRESGFLYDPQHPIHVVRTPHGLTTLDNTRVALAQELSLDRIVVTVHDPFEALPEIMIRVRRLGNAKTWGEALEYRMSRQHPEPLPLYGTPQRPLMPSDRD